MSFHDGHPRISARVKLGEIVFADESKRRELNAATHTMIALYLVYDIVVALLQGVRCTCACVCSGGESGSRGV
jgi:hypothetical protein